MRVSKTPINPYSKDERSRLCLQMESDTRSQLVVRGLTPCLTVSQGAAIVVRHDRAGRLYRTAGEPIEAVCVVGRAGSATLISPTWALSRPRRVRHAAREAGRQTQLQRPRGLDPSRRAPPRLARHGTTRPGAGGTGRTLTLVGLIGTDPPTRAHSAGPRVPPQWQAKFAQPDLGLSLWRRGDEQDVPRGLHSQRRAQRPRRSVPP